MGASPITRSIASAWSSEPGNTPPRMAPLSRMWRTSALVSMPDRAGIPQSASHVSQPPSARGASSRSTPSRMTTARACTASDSMWSAATP